MDFNIENRHNKSYSLVSVEGELDIATAPQLRLHLANLVAEGHINIILDLSQVSFLDSTGLGIIVGAYKRIREHQGSLKIVCEYGPIIETFEVTGLNKSIPIFSSVIKAVEDNAGGH